VADAFSASLAETLQSCIVYLSRLAHFDRRQVTGRSGQKDLHFRLSAFGELEYLRRRSIAKSTYLELYVAVRNSRKTKLSELIRDCSRLATNDRDFGVRYCSRRILVGSANGAARLRAQLTRGSEKQNR
jgi:hypothetical protein